jgi:Mg2+/Co2+ transporter CorC
MAIDDVNELMQVELPTDQSDTLGGFIYDQLGEVPEVGATVRYAGLLFEVLAVSDRRILKVKVTYERPEQKNGDAPSADAERKANGKTQDTTDREQSGSGRSGEPS